MISFEVMSLLLVALEYLIHSHREKRGRNTFEEPTGSIVRENMPRRCEG
jgi:hypothetical protein